MRLEAFFHSSICLECFNNSCIEGLDLATQKIHMTMFCEYVVASQQLRPDSVRDDFKGLAPSVLTC